jgi:hypothetical protein
LKRVGVGAVLVIRDGAERRVEDEKVDDFRTVAATKTVVVRGPGKGSLNQAPRDGDDCGRIVEAGVRHPGAGWWVCADEKD